MPPVVNQSSVMCARVGIECDGFNNGGGSPEHSCEPADGLGMSVRARPAGRPSGEGLAAVQAVAIIALGGGNRREVGFLTRGPVGRSRGTGGEVR